MGNKQLKVFFVLDTPTVYTEQVLKEKLQDFIGDSETVADMWFQEFNPSGDDEEIEQYQKSDFAVTIYQRGDTLGTATPAFLANIKGSVRNRGCKIQDVWDEPITFTSLEIIKRAVAEWINGRMSRFD